MKRSAISTDIGGAFTDLAFMDRQGSTRTAQVPSTPTDYAEGSFGVSVG